MEPQGVIGKCKRECATIAESCNELFEQIDDSRDEISIALWKGTSQSDLTQQICSDLAEVCPAKSKHVNRKFDEEFTPKTSKEIEMDQLMEKMKGIPGMGGYNILRIRVRGKT